MPPQEGDIAQPRQSQRIPASRQLFQAGANDRPFQPQASAGLDSATAAGSDDNPSHVKSALGQAFSAFGHHVGNLGTGLAQLAAHHNLAASILDHLSEDSHLRRIYDDYVEKPLDNFVAQREARYQRDVPDSAASYAGAALGEILPLALSGGTNALGSAGAKVANLIPRVEKSSALLRGLLSATRGAANGATQGAVLGAAAPTTQGAGGDYDVAKLGQIKDGALFGGALGSGGTLVPGMLRTARKTYLNTLSPEYIAGSNLARNVGSDAETLAKLDAAGDGGIPGVMPTTAQAAPSSGAVLAEKNAGNGIDGFKQDQINLSLANNSARLDYLRQFAGNDDALAALRGTRRSNAQPFIDKYLQPSFPAGRFASAGKAVDTLLDTSHRMPTGDVAALRSAQRLFAQVRRGDIQEDDAFELLKPIEESLSSKRARDALDNAYTEIDRNQVDPTKLLNSLKEMRYSGPGGHGSIRSTLNSTIAAIQEAQNTRGLVPLDYLDGVRQDIARTLNKENGKPATAQEHALLDPVRDQIQKTLERRAPRYSDYLAQYARDSAPINTMEFIQGLLDRNRGRAANASGETSLTLNEINQALRQDARARYPITDEATDALTRVRDSIQREGISNSTRFPGSDTAYNLQAKGWLPGYLFGKDFGGSTRPLSLLGAATGAIAGDVTGAAGSTLGHSALGALGAQTFGRLAKGIQSKYAEGLQNPQEASRLIRAYLDRQAPSNRLAFLRKNPQIALLLGSEAAIAPDAPPSTTAP